jgi:hypothetical protein
LRPLVEAPRVDEVTDIDRRRMKVPLAGLPPRIQVLPGWLTRDNAEALAYYLLASLPLLAFVRIAGRSTGLVASPLDRRMAAYGLSAAVLCAFAVLFILRNPVRARYAAVAVPSVVLVAWLLRDTRHADRTRSRALNWIFGTSACGAMLTVVMLTPMVGHLRPMLDGARQTSPLAAVMADQRARWMKVTTPSVDDAWVTGYLSRCTLPSDRVLVTGFMPEIPFRANRPFAGGLLLSFSGHWSTPADQQWVIARLHRESVPLVVNLLPDRLAPYPVLSEYVHRNYVLAGESTFKRGPEVFQIFAKRVFPRPVSADYATGFPCFGADADP